MVKLLLAVCVLLVGFTVSAQNVVVKKSSDVVVIRGASYYLHVVEEGQTLYSICKAYGVDVETVKQLNDKKDNALSLLEVLKIPYTEPFTSQDKNYYYHKVQKGETLYSISRKFGIKVKRITKENEQYDGAVSLPIGAVVRLPLDEIDMAAVKAEKAANAVLEKEKTAQATADVAKNVHEEHPVIKPVEEHKPVVTEKKPETAVKPVEPVRQEPVKEPIHSVTTEISEQGTIPGYLSDVMLTEGRPVKVALLLPLYAKNVDSTKISGKAEPFVFFYEGILMAADSLKKKGMNIDLMVYDTERDTRNVAEIANELNQVNPDLIIGPVYSSTYKTLMDNLNNRNIPVVYPLSNRLENLGMYPNFVQVNASVNTLADQMTAWLAAKSDTVNIINIRLSGKKGDAAVSGKAEEKLFTDRTERLNGVSFFNWDMEHEPLAALKNILNPHKENIIILPTISEAVVSKLLPSLSLYAGTYRITVVGLPEWQTFTSVDHETYYKLNVKLFNYCYVDYQTDKAKNFAALFRNYFHAEPSNLANKAYDIGLYFISMADKYRDRTLEALTYFPQDGLFSRFSFSPIHGEKGLENKGLYIINYGSDYQLKLKAMK